MKHTVVGVDVAKRVFQLHWVENASGEIVSLKLRREKFLEHFAKRALCVVGMEACGGSQHRARELVKLGHEVKLISARKVNPFVDGNKNDAADARAIWTAMHQPGIKAVAIRSEAQQAVLALHRMRSQLVKFRTAQINALRGLLTEYGAVMPQGRAGIERELPRLLEPLADRLPGMVIETLREQFARIGELDIQIQGIERRLRQWHQQDSASQRIGAILEWDYSRPPRRSSRWENRRLSGPGVSSPPGWRWSRASTAWGTGHRVSRGYEDRDQRSSAVMGGRRRLQRIGGRLGLDVKTVRRYVRAAQLFGLMRASGEAAAASCLRWGSRKCGAS